jgi:ATP-dependent DNA helicase RecQ
MIFFDAERLPKRDVYISPQTYGLRKELMVERLNNMLSYANNESECRSVLIERYFFGQEHESQPCGLCDSCLAARRRAKPSQDAVKTLEEQIVEALRGGSLTTKQLVAAVGGNEQHAVQVVRSMLDQGRVRLTEGDGRIELVG